MGAKLDTKTLLFGNIRGLYPKSNRTKIKLLEDMAHENDSAIIALTETHLNSDINDAEVSINDYELHRCDRSNRSHGGVIIFTKKIYRSVKILEIANTQCEVIGVLLKDIKTIIICIYRPPKSGNKLIFQEICDKIQFTINNFASQAQKVILCGDLNFPFISWPEGSFQGRYTSIEREKSQASDFLDMMDINNMTNISLVPTRLCNIIDELLTNDEENISYRNTIINKNISDHNLIFFNINMTKTMTCATKVNPYDNKIFEYDTTSEGQQWEDFAEYINEFDYDENDILNGDD